MSCAGAPGEFPWQARASPLTQEPVPRVGALGVRREFGLPEVRGREPRRVPREHPSMSSEPRHPPMG